MAEQSRSERDRVRRQRGSTPASRAAADAEGREMSAEDLAAAERRKESDAERRRRRAVFLRELAEARELRERVHPRRTKERRMREAVRMRTFRF